MHAGGGQGFAQPTLTPELTRLRRLAFASLFDTAQVARAQLELEDEAARLAEHLLALTASDAMRAGVAPVTIAMGRALWMSPRQERS